MTVIVDSSLAVSGRPVVVVVWLAACSGIPSYRPTAQYRHYIYGDKVSILQYVHLYVCMII